PLAKAPQVAVETPIPIQPTPQITEDVPVLKSNEDANVLEDEVVLDTPKPDAIEITAPTKSQNNQLLLFYIGQLHGTYLLAQNEEGLFIVDQHAAMERVQYEKIYRKLSAVSRDCVELLVPVMVPLTLNEIIKLKPSFKSLLDWGFEVEEFGQNALVIRSVPTWAQNEDIQQIVETIMQQLLYDNGFQVGKLRESVAITMSCKGSIKANQYINEVEIKQLLQDLCLCEQPYTCPHGRPIIVKLTKYEIEKLFKRVM
ncbi:MAG TPA: DNA mismatch repair protein MutL, partial [Firmicutes bacterium]|nr:DNA mismatch repair protein MutL [Bacillota bacterium]